MLMAELLKYCLNKYILPLFFSFELLSKINRFLVPEILRKIDFKNL